MKLFKRNRGVKNTLKTNFSRNVLLKKGIMAKIHYWEHDKSSDVIRSNFNREHYYSYLNSIG